MRWLVVLSLAAALALVAGRTRNSFDDVDLEMLLKDEPQWRAIYRCLMDRGPCLPEMQRFKDMLPGLVQKKCEQCSSKQKEKFDQAIKLIASKYPSDLQDLMAKYSPKTELN
ncbi:ejaculatory bulb-specific protein 3-like [Pectinophora gossypiella]|uniref:ejaculatory bulb-specific protein 3-like n=1 Tax=Pectinophora gossypiella TaxID=13191 RepID=UPI00214F18FB|nr:ejaculatory bulb-specific protein 3-like [Pectinophora gossypiella]